MGLLDFFNFKAEGVSSKNSAKFEKSFQEILSQIAEKKKNSETTFSAYGSLPAMKSIMQENENLRKEFLLFIFDLIIRNWKKSALSSLWWDNPTYYALKLIPVVLREIEMNEDDLYMTAKAFTKLRDVGVYRHELPVSSVIDAMEKTIRRNGLTPRLKDSLEIIRHAQNTVHSSEQVKENERVDFLLQGDPDTEISKHDEWGTMVIDFLGGLELEIRKAWTALFRISKEAEGKSTPTQKWLKEAQPLVQKIGSDMFAKKMIDWLQILRGLIQELHKDKDYSRTFLRNENHEIIKGLIWCCGFVNDNNLHTTLDEYAAIAYRKKPGVGPISAKTGTAAMFAFSLLPVKEGVSRLSKFRMKIKNNSILKSIDKILKTVSEKNAMEMADMEELSLPDFGIVLNTFSATFGEWSGVYRIDNSEVSWEKDGKTQKSVPADIRSSHAEALKLFKNSIKEIDELLPVVKNRIEQTYLKQRSWPYPEWTTRYLNHPLASIVATRLIWHFSNGEQKDQGIWLGGHFVNERGQILSWIDEKTQVQLWHPLGFESSYILSWRNFLREKNIIQPFKQAFREVYIITDAELRTNTYSNRFAAHILRQHQFAALCRQRGWQYHLMGAWDSHNTPIVRLPEWNLSAEYVVNADWQAHEGNTNSTGIFNIVSTDQVRFLRENGPLALSEVPAIVFSEVMRDVDLFVGVTSIGNDAAWQDGGDNFQNTYWREYSFSDLTESAKVRKEVLESLVPSLKIASLCSFDKKFLIVKGKLRTYKIHIGSGNILMEPDDQYLCIVPDGRNPSKEKVFLPFEGDTLLSIVLSKAFLLAADDKISDPTITRQIKK
jgi:hypothetical protein